MPFTPSHAIVALPFARTPLPAGAVAIGAMAPDLPLFFPWVAPYSVTHGIPSLLWVSLPIALVLYAVWRLVLRPAASGLLLPEALRARMPYSWDRGGWDDIRRSGRPVRDVALVVLAALIGVVSHVVWDLFTHAGRLGSEWIPALAEPWGPLPGTAWLQHASSALGLLGLAAWAVVAARRAGVVHRSDPPAVGVIRVLAWVAAGVSLATWAAVTLWRDGLPTTYRMLADVAFDAGTAAGATILVVAVLAALAVRLVRRAARVRYPFR